MINMNHQQPTNAPALLEYSVVGDAITHWLVAGPLAVSVPDLERFPGADFKTQIARACYQPTLEIEAEPAEASTFELNRGDGDLVKFTWETVHCDDDRFVDMSAFYHTCHHLRTWAYAQVHLSNALETTGVLTTNGPADIWINGRHVHRQLHFHHQIPHSVPFPLRLEAGRNDVMVRFEGVAVRECPYVMALEMHGLTAVGGVIRLPTAIEQVRRRNLLEEVVACAYLTRSIFHRDEELHIHWSDKTPRSTTLTVRLAARNGRIYAEGQPTVEAGSVTNFGPVYQIPSGEYDIVLLPLPEEHYVHGLRIRRRLPVRISNDRYAEQPYGSYDQRRQEALMDAAGRTVNVFAEIAKMALGRWQDVRNDVVLRTIDDINRRADCSDFYLVGLLGMMIRYWDDPSFPAILREQLESCVLNFRYWLDEPGEDAMCFWSENHQILFHACAVLAGQLYPDRVFSNTGQTGRWHQAKGEAMTLSWLQKRAAGGFREWDSNTYFEEDTLALTHLADLAESDEVAEMAAVVLDKLFFTLAVNSFRGVFGSTHGRTYSPFIKSGRMEPTSGMGRLAFGMGCFNDRILGTVSLACATNYEVPAIIAAIAADRPDELWNRERHAGMMEAWCDLQDGPWEVNKVTYKTPDYMLSSAQDFAPGTRGYQQHIWQATFGPDAVIFVTHPPCVSEEGSHRPNFWHGNVVLPRVAQWKDFLIAVHNFPPDDWMGFTHAYFPTAAFDEYTLRNGWAFARKESGYIALTASRGIDLTASGLSAYQELRSYGCQNTWLCHMGRAAVDGGFGDFQEKILALDIRLSDLEARAETLRGQHVRFGWQDPLLVGGVEQPLSGFKHYENPYCEAEHGAGDMLLRYQDQALRLVFGQASV
jgi:hypothetical protein